VFVEYQVEESLLHYALQGVNILLQRVPVEQGWQPGNTPDNILKVGIYGAMFEIDRFNINRNLILWQKRVMEVPVQSNF